MRPAAVQMRAYSAEIHARPVRAEMSGWVDVTKQLNEATLGMSLVQDRYDKLQRISKQFHVSFERQGTLVSAEKRRHALLQKIRDDSEQRLEEVAKARRQQEEEREKRKAEREALLAEQKKLQEEERRIKEEQDAVRKAEMQARFDAQQKITSPDREARLKMLEVDEEEREAKQRLRDEHKQQIEERSRQQRAAQQQRGETHTEAAPQEGAAAGRDWRQDQKQEEVSFVDASPEVVPARVAEDEPLSESRTTTILEKFRNPSRTMFQAKTRQAVPKKAHVQVEAVHREVGTTQELPPGFDVDPVLEEPALAGWEPKRGLGEDGKVQESAAPPAMRLPDIKPANVRVNRSRSTGFADLPGETHGPGHEYKSWMDTKFISDPKSTDTIKWVIKSSGFTTGSLCLADLMEKRHAFSDKERAELLLVDVHRQREVRSRDVRYNSWAAMSPEALIRPVRQSEKLVPFDMASLNAYLMLLAELRLPSEALRVWKSYGMEVESPKTWLHAISALFSFTKSHQSSRAAHSAIDAFTKTAEGIFQVYKEEVFDVLTELADIKSDPLKPTSAHRNVTDFYGAVAMMIRAYTKLGHFVKADALWQEVGRGATPTAKRAYLARLAGEPTRARELLMSIPELDRTEYDYRTVITAYAQQGNIFEAEKVFSMVPPVTLTQDKEIRVRTTTILLHGYNEQAKLMSDLTPAEQTDMFLKGAESVQKRLEELQFTEEILLEFKCSLVQTLTKLYQERPAATDPSREKLAKYESHEESNKLIADKVDEVRKEAGFPLELPDNFILKPSTKLVVFLLGFYSKSLDGKRAESLLEVIVIPKHFEKKFRDIVLRTLVKASSRTSSSLGTIKISDL